MTISASIETETQLLSEVGVPLPECQLSVDSVFRSATSQQRGSYHDRGIGSALSVSDSDSDDSDSSLQISCVSIESARSFFEI